MDSLITAAARALAAGDPLGALNRVALRDDPSALALRGLAMAQLGDFARAKFLLRSAARGFGPNEALARARCAVAEAEIALVSRDLGWPTKVLESAQATLTQRGDHLNAAHARTLVARRLILLGRVDEAEAALAEIDPVAFPAASRAAYQMVVAGIAVRRLRIKSARAALALAAQAAQEAGITALSSEIDGAFAMLDAPASRIVTPSAPRTLRLDDVELLFASGAWVVDACRHVVRIAQIEIRLATRPVLFALARALAEAWPNDATRATLIARAFKSRVADESHRARLRVEIGRLRGALESVAEVTATARGFVLKPRDDRNVIVLVPLVEDAHAAVLALLADGESWSSSALALALGSSQRSVQRSLESLAAADKVQTFGRGRARRWLRPSVPGFPTTLLLPAPPAV